MVEGPQVVVHEADQPDFFIDFFDADILTGEHGALIDLREPKHTRPHIVTAMVRSWNGYSSSLKP
jgi:hypothetical protein